MVEINPQNASSATAAIQNGPLPQEEVPYVIPVRTRDIDEKAVYESKLYPGVTYVFTLKRKNKDGSVIYRCNGCERVEKMVRARRVYCPELRTTSFKSVADRWEQDPDYPTMQPHCCILSPLQQGALLRKAVKNRLLEPDLIDEDYSKQIRELDTKEMTFDACVAYIDRLRLPVLPKLTKDFLKNGSEASESGHWLDETQNETSNTNEFEDTPQSSNSFAQPQRRRKAANHIIHNLRRKHAGPDREAAGGTANIITNGTEDVNQMLNGSLSNGHATSSHQTHNHHHYCSHNNQPISTESPEVKKMKMQLLVLKKQVCEQQIESAKRMQEAADAILQVIPQLNAALNLISNDQQQHQAQANLYNINMPHANSARML